MSEASRARRQRYLNVREELAWREAQRPQPEPIETEPDLDPTWGPVGSLARQLLDPTDYAHLLQLHNDILARRGQRRTEQPDNQPAPVETPKEPPAQNRVPGPSQTRSEPKVTDW